MFPVWRAGISSLVSSEFPYEARANQGKSKVGSSLFLCSRKRHSPAVFADKLSAAPSEETSVMSADKTSTLSADKKSLIAQDIQTALQRRL